VTILAWTATSAGACSDGEPLEQSGGASLDQPVAASSDADGRLAPSVVLSQSTVVVPQDGSPSEIGSWPRGCPAELPWPSMSSDCGGRDVRAGWFSRSCSRAHAVFSSTPTSAAGTYSASVVVTVGTRSASQPLTIVVAAVAAVSSAVDTGRAQRPMGAVSEHVLSAR